MVNSIILTHFNILWPENNNKYTVYSICVPILNVINLNSIFL